MKTSQEAWLDDLSLEMVVYRSLNVQEFGHILIHTPTAPLTSYDDHYELLNSVIDWVPILAHNLATCEENSRGM